MRLYLCIGAVLLASAVCFPQTTETGAVNKTVLRAKRVLVTTMRGPDADPSRVSVDDQRAVAAVESELRRWKRYEVTRISQDADIIVAVRKAPGFGITVGNPRLGSRVPPAVNTPFPETTDSLAVFDAHGLGMEAPPLWTAAEAGGLNTPDIRLMKKFRKRVEDAEKRP
jgi:hypothetical protein